MAVAGAAAAITTGASSVAKSVTDASTTSTFRVCAKPLNLSRYQGPPAFSRRRAFALRGKTHQTRYQKIYLPALMVGLGSPGPPGVEHGRHEGGSTRYTSAAHPPSPAAHKTSTP